MNEIFNFSNSEAFSGHFTSWKKTKKNLKNFCRRFYTLVKTVAKKVLGITFDKKTQLCNEFIQRANKSSKIHDY